MHTLCDIQSNVTPKTGMTSSFKMKTIFLLFLFIKVNGINGSAFTLSSAFGTLHDPKLPNLCYGGDLSESLKSGINDIVIVRQSDGSLKSTPLQARVGKLSNWKTVFKSREGKLAKIYVNNVRALVFAHVTLE